MWTSHSISNSSCVWWGAWLADAKDVYYPAQWFGAALSQKNQIEIVCKHWKMSGEIVDEGGEVVKIDG